MTLPLMIGNSFNKNLGKENFHKVQHFNFAHGLPFVVRRKTPSNGRELPPVQRTRPKHFPKGHGSDLPSWIAYDKQVLSFDAYFHEAVPQGYEKTYRIRKCKIYFFLEDDTIKVVEPEVKNSGMTQGTFIRRHRIPLPPPNNHKFYNVHHFNVNQEVVFYSRPFMITDCDRFTHDFLKKIGVLVNNPAETPTDLYTNQQQLEDSNKPLYEKHHPLKQFLEKDGNVLRFYCYWEDHHNKFGFTRQLTMQYYLADDTIEIREVVCPNARRDAVPKFLRRSKLPKHMPVAKHQLGEITDRTVLNVFGQMGEGGRYILDSARPSADTLIQGDLNKTLNPKSLQGDFHFLITGTVFLERLGIKGLVQGASGGLGPETGPVKQEFYKDTDLSIGAVINVWGRKVVIYDCDKFTKDYYRSKYGIEDFTPVKFKVPIKEKVVKQVPPYTGFGSEEDSFSSCLSLVPKPPKKDLKTQMEKDRQGLVSNILRFMSKMVTNDPIKKERTFVISFYLSDGTISVFEPSQRNSGILGGKFLERCRVKKPGQEIFKVEMSDYYKAQDMYVGAQICIGGQIFQLVNADEFVFNYMDQHSEEFPKANVGTILSKLKSIPEEKQKELKQFLALSDPGSTGFISYKSLRSLLADTDCQLSEHEIMTLGRTYSSRKQPELDVDLMLAIAQDHLKKKHFDGFSDLVQAFTYEDRDRTGYLSSNEARIICKSFRLPVDDDLLRALLQKFENSSGNVDYHAFITGINWRVSPTRAAQPDHVMKLDVDWNEEVAVNTVHYSALLEDAFGSAGDVNIN